MMPILGFIAVLALLSMPALASEPSASERRFGDARPIVIAHRGCWQSGPENSLAALRACALAGIDMAEIDVRTTRDGVMVLMHDDTLDRTSTLTGPVHAKTYAELRKGVLRQGHGGPGAPLTGEPIPRLADVLAATDERLLLLVDVKEDNYLSIETEVIAAGAAGRVALLVYAAPDDPSIRGLGKLAYIPVLNLCEKEQPAGCYTDADIRAERFRSDYRSLRPIAVTPLRGDRSLESRWVSPLRSVGFSYEADLGVAPFSSRTPDAWDRLLALNATAFFTDYAMDLKRHLQARGLLSDSPTAR